jgi:hypothetical protein
VAKKAGRRSGAKAAHAARRTDEVAITPEGQILRQAAVYCLHTFPMLWTVGDIKEEREGPGSRRWIIAVHLSYPTGHEGYLGDLLYDGEKFTELTDRDTMKERSKRIAADPALQREWDTYRAPTLRLLSRPSGFGKNSYFARVNPAPFPSSP